jgi:pimeloyl-ACP methyl ester carboxylesterase
MFVDGPAGKLSVRLWPGPKDTRGFHQLPLTRAIPVCFVHPVNTGGAVWDAVAASVAFTHTCIVPDLRGHGGSDPGDSYLVEDYVADVRAVLDHFGADRVHLVGASIGGPVGVMLAALEPDRVATLAGFGISLALRLPDGALDQALAMLGATGTRATFEVLAPGAVAAGADPALAAVVVELASNGRAAEMVGRMMVGAFSTDVTPLAARVAVPALVANGTEDATCTADDARRMGELLPDCRVEILDGVGHLPMLEAPGVVARLLAELFPKGESS